MPQLRFVQYPVCINGQGFYVDTPDACPVCHRHQQSEVIRAEWVQGGTNLQVVFRCGYQQCKVFFVCTYMKDGTTHNFLGVSPTTIDPSTFPETIKNVSPSFVDIFNEAESAHQLGFEQVAGPGYRKAFEFLIKDYANSLAPNDDVLKMKAGDVVKKLIPDPRIQKVAERSLWLGNDETHYMRKWVDRDIEDLVTLIKLTASWIDIGERSKKYVDEMPDPSKKTLPITTQ